MKLQPILDDLKEVVTERGRYEVQIDIPKNSTLTESEIDKIAKLGSWGIDPSQAAEGFEGIRSVVIDRKSPIVKGNIELGGLQISGIGFKDFNMMSRNPSISESRAFHPPSKENFMSRVAGNWMSTSHAEGRSVVNTRPEYRALGTYTAKELENKIMKTTEAANIRLERMVTPHVEAYGRFLNKDLQNSEGEFGFIVFPVPKSGKKRVGDEINEALLAAELEGGERAAAAEYSPAVVPPLSRISKGLRELHDKGRLAHLQTHINNFYLVDGKPYLVDWSTSVKLGSNVDENLVNRTIDLKRPADDVVSTFMKFFGVSPDRKIAVDTIAYRTALQAYYGNPEMPLNIKSVYKGAYNMLGGQGTELEMFVEWMRNKGIERLSPKAIMYKDMKVGRNEPCPCGSGTKYKKCCGG